MALKLLFIIIYYELLGTSSDAARGPNFSVAIGQFSKDVKGGIMRPLNLDYIEEDEKLKIKKIAQKKGITATDIGRMCGVSDSGFWCRLINGKKPVPERVRQALTQFYLTEEV